MNDLNIDIILNEMIHKINEANSLLEVRSMLEKEIEKHSKNRK